MSGLRALVAAPFVATLACATTRRATPGPTFDDVYVAGVGGYASYRVPSIVATRRGTLLAFAEGRRTGAGDAGDIDLVVRRSRNGGRTWSTMQVIGDNGPNTFGNPCAVVDARTGAIVPLATQNRGTDRERDIVAGTAQRTRTVSTMRSADDGVTWSTPIDITSSVKRPDWTWYATRPGIGIQTRTERLVMPANHAESGTRIHRSHLVYSDDGGLTWHLGASADAGTDESQVVELADGRLRLDMRNHAPKPQNFRQIAMSDDGGRTLSPTHPDSALVEPRAQASIIRLTGRRDRLLFANPASQRGTRSPHETITFARCSLDWLTRGQDRP